MHYEPAEVDAPKENLWSSELYLEFVDLSVLNFGIQEYMRHSGETARVFPHSYTFADGMMLAAGKPGLGVAIDEALAAYLPINRKLDGTMHSW